MDDYQYKRRDAQRRGVPFEQGRERTEAQVVRHGQRVLSRMQEAGAA